MAKFMYLYRGPATDMSDMTPEQSDQVMDQWRTWLTGIGSALADPGSPMGNSASVFDDGSQGTPCDLNGYTIVEAQDLEGAVKLTEGHPFLTADSGDFSIEVFQLFPLPF